MGCSHSAAFLAPGMHGPRKSQQVCFCSQQGGPARAKVKCISVVHLTKALRHKAGLGLFGLFNVGELLSPAHFSQAKQ